MNEVNVIEEKFTRCPRCRSFSVKKTEANFIEGIKDRFVPVTVQFCNNCSYRFAEYGKFSVTYNKNWLLVAVPLVVVAALVAVFFAISGEKTTHMNPPDKKPPVKETKDIPPPPTTTIEKDLTEEKTEEKTESKPDEIESETPEVKEEEKDPPVEITEDKPEITIENEIVIENSNRFGVNWSPVENGVKITRLSPGPLKSAGLQLGDVFSEIDGQKITTGNLLLNIRNEIFREKRGGALIKVYRNNDLFYYRLVKRPGQESEPSTQPRESKSPSPETGPPMDIPPSAQNKPIQSPIKVFRADTIKKRNSAPNSESAAHRWCYLKKKVTVKRESHQKVYIAGNAAGIKNWGVDDQLIINGKKFNGLSRSYEKKAGPLPDSCKCPPLDITDLVPPGKESSLLIQLADHGIQWANTDIYVVVK